MVWESGEGRPLNSDTNLGVALSTPSRFFPIQAPVGLWDPEQMHSDARDEKVFIFPKNSP